MTKAPPPPTDDAKLAFALAAALLAAAVLARLSAGRRETVPASFGRWLVDVNEAPADEIEAVPGVGPVLAGRIVAERANGAFATVADLARVPGVGPTTIERMRAFVTCGRDVRPPR